MIIVSRTSTGRWAWVVLGVSREAIRALGRLGAGGYEYESAEHAIRDAWTWWPEPGTLISTRPRPRP